MLKKSCSVAAIVGAALLAPSVGRAAVITFTYDSAQIATNSAFTQGLQTIAVVGNTLTVPQGDFVRFGMSTTVTGNANAAAGGAYSTDVQAQPALLGLGSFGFSLTNPSNTIATPVVVSGKSTAKSPTVFTGVRFPGAVDAAGDVGAGATANLLAAGVNSPGVDASDPSQFGALTIGAAGPQDVFTVLAYSALSAGTDTLVGAIPSPTTNVTLIALGSGGTDDGTPPVYTSRLFSTTTDTLVGPGNLTINVSAVPEPASIGLLAVGALGLISRRRKA